MNNFIGVCMSFFLSFASYGQTSLHFDGQDDYVDLNSISTVMDTISDFTLDFWVVFDEYENADYGVFFACNTFDYQNVFLIRVGNDAFDPINGSAVVYINDSGNQYISGTSNIGDNECHHIGFTYSNGVCKLYIDGSLEASASHAINFSSTDVFSFGQEYDAVTNPTSNFYKGSLDNFRVWNTEKSALDMVNLMNSSSSLVTSNLKLEYLFEDGLPNGNNSGISSISNSSNSVFDGSLQNFGLNGSESNFINGYCLNSIVNLNFDTTICNGVFESPYFGVVVESGIYFDTIFSGTTIDTIRRLDLEIASDYIDDDIFQLNDSTIISYDTLSSFQWLDCEGFTPIVGATSSTFTPGSLGYYALELNYNGCLDTSFCLGLKEIGIDEFNLQIEIHFNSYLGQYILSSSNIHDDVEIEIININGQIILSESNSILPYYLPKLESGYYILKVNYNNGGVKYNRPIIMN